MMMDVNVSAVSSQGDSLPSKLVKNLQGHEEPTRCVTVIDEGFIASGSVDKTIKVWDTDLEKCIHTLRGHEDTIEAITSISGDRVTDVTLISGSKDKTIKIWMPWRTETCLSTLRMHSGAINCISQIESDPPEFASGSTDKTIQIWRLDTKPRALKGHSESVDALVGLPQRRLASGSQDRTIRIWDRDTGKCLQILKGDTGGICALALMPNDDLVSQCDHREPYGAGWLPNGSIKIWERNSDAKKPYSLKSSFGVKPSKVKSLIGFDESIVIFGDHRDCVIVKNIDSGKNLRILKTVGKISDIAISDKTLICASGKDIQIWGNEEQDDIQLRHVNSIFTNSRDNEKSSFTLLGNEIAATCHKDGVISFWDMKGACIGKTSSLKGLNASTLSQMPDGTLAIGGSRGEIAVCHNTEGCLRILEGNTWGRIVGLKPLNGLLVSVSGGGVVYVWNTVTGKCIRTFKVRHYLGEYYQFIHCLATTRENIFILGYGDGTIKLWDFASKAMIKTLKGHLSAVTALSVLPNGKLASMSDDHIMIWDIQNGTRLHLLEDSADSTALEVLPNGILVSGCKNGRIKFWDTNTGRCLHNSINDPRGITGLKALSNDQLIVYRLGKAHPDVWKITNNSSAAIESDSINESDLTGNIVSSTPSGDDGSVPGSWIIGTKEIVLLSRKGKLYYRAVDLNTEKKPSYAEVSLNGKTAEGYRDYLLRKCEPLVDSNGAVSFRPCSPACLKWITNEGDEIKLIRHKDQLIWQLFYKSTQTISRVPFENACLYNSEGSSYYKKLYADKLDRESEDYESQLENLTREDIPIGSIFKADNMQTLCFVSDCEIKGFEVEGNKLKSVTLIKPYEVSHYDKNIIIDKDHCALTLINTVDLSTKDVPMDARLMGHSAIIIEKFDEDSKYVMCKAHLTAGKKTNDGFIGKVNYTPIPRGGSRCEGQSETWSVTKDRCREMEFSIDEEIEALNLDQPRVYYNIKGSESVLHVMVSSLKYNTHNCTTWALDKLRMAGINPSDRTDLIYSSPKSYVKPKDSNL